MSLLHLLTHPACAPDLSIFLLGSNSDLIYFMKEVCGKAPFAHVKLLRSWSATSANCCGYGKRTQIRRTWSTALEPKAIQTY
jgi:hypothetical protein